jgi:hypothetical protein
MRQALEQPRGLKFIFSESDWPFAAIPGLYTSLDRTSPWAQSWAFLFYLDEVDAPPIERPDFLFSFVGRLDTHFCRRAVRRLDSVVSPCLDTSEVQTRYPETPWEYVTGYSQLILNSSFVLCPRGFGASSMRLFEAMRLGRPPVVISDAWLPPPGPDWEAFSLRVAEKDIMDIPEILSQERRRAAEMGRRAKIAYQDYFAPSTFLDNALDYCVANFKDSAGMHGPVRRIVSSITRGSSRRWRLRS